jgi:hypothetical protein
LRDLTTDCAPRLETLMPGDTTLVEDLVKFREMFRF